MSNVNIYETAHFLHYVRDAVDVVTVVYQTTTMPVEPIWALHSATLLEPTRPSCRRHNVPQKWRACNGRITTDYG